MAKKEVKNRVWKIRYETLTTAAGDEWDYSDTQSALGYPDPASAVELVKRSAMKGSWFALDEDGKETKKKVTVKGFRVIGISLETIIDIV